MISPIDLYNVSLKLFLKNEKGEILVMKTLAELNKQSKYDVPGGRINEDEFAIPFEQILRREVSEELGDEIMLEISSNPVALGRKKDHITIGRKKSQIQSNKTTSILFVFFEGKYCGGKIKVNEEYCGFDWINPDNPEHSARFITGIYDAWQQYETKVK